MSKKRMFHRIALSVLVLTGIARGGPVTAQTAEGAAPDANRQPAPAEGDTEVAELIAELGANSFQSREAAMAELLVIGPRALPTLSRLRPESDPEVRERIDVIRERLVKDDREARIEEFLSSDDGYLPGWSHARSQLGDNQAGRELFVQITRRHPELTASLEESAREQIAAMEQTTQKLMAATRSTISEQPSPADAISLLLLAANEKTPASESTDAAILRLVRHRDVLRGLTDSQLMNPFRHLLGQWMRKVSKSRRVDALYFAMQMNLQDGLALALTTLSDNEDAEALEFAMRAIARFGRPSDALLVEPLLGDERAAGQGYLNHDAAGRPLRVVVGDVAMATVAMVHQRGLRDVGFPAAETHPIMAFDVDTLGFPVGSSGDEARQRVRDEIDALLEATKKAEGEVDEREGKAD